MAPNAFLGSIRIDFGWILGPNLRVRGGRPMPLWMFFPCRVRGQRFQLCPTLEEFKGERPSPDVGVSESSLGDSNQSHPWPARAQKCRWLQVSESSLGVSIFGNGDPGRFVSNLAACSADDDDVPGKVRGHRVQLWPTLTEF